MRNQVVTFLLFLALQLSSGDALSCYQCTNVTEPMCGDNEFSISRVPKLECEAIADGVPRSKYAPDSVESPACVRYDGLNAEGNRYTVRGCSPYGEATCDSLKQAAEDEGSILEHCETCTDNLCNSGFQHSNNRTKRFAGIIDFFSSFF